MVGIFDETETISSEEFDLFLKKKGIPLECSQCGYGPCVPLPAPKQLGLEFLQTERPLVIRYLSEAGEKNVYEYPAIPLVCPDCGYVRNFMTGAIVNWKRDRTS